MANCTYLYFDHRGQESQVYKDSLELYGPKVAEEMYIRDMFEVDKFKFKEGEKIKRPNIKVFDNLNNNIKSDKKQYTSKVNTGIKYDSVSFVVDNLSIAVRPKIKGIMDAFNLSIPMEDRKTGDEQRDDLAAENWESVLKKKHPTISQITDPELQEDAIKEEMIKDPYLSKKWIVFTQKMYQASEDQGNYVHYGVAGILKLVEKKRARVRRAKAKGDDLSATFKMSDADYILSLDYKSIMDIIEKKYKYKGDAPQLKTIAISIVKDIAKVEQRAGIEPGTLILRPEQKLRSDAMKMAGTADLILLDPDGFSAWIYDIKTKTVYHTDVNDVREFDGSAFNFWTLTGKKIGDPFGDKDATPANKAAAQMSFYAAMLHEMGYTVRGANVVIANSFQGVKREDMLKSPERARHEHSGLFIDKNYGVAPVSIRAEAAFMHMIPGETFDDLLEAKREGGFYGILNEWADNQIGYAGDERVGKKRYIENKVNRMLKDNHGNYVYQDDNPRSSTHREQKIIPKMMYENDRKRVEELIAIEWDGRQADRKTIATMVVDQFNSKKDDKIVFGDRGVSVSNLVAGLDPEYWTLVIAQDHNPELYGDLGPDMILGLHNDPDNHSIVVLSALGSVNKRLTFEGDGDKGPLSGRNTIFGNFVTDREVYGNSDIGNIVENSSNTEFNLVTIKLLVLAMKHRKYVDPKAFIDHMKVGGIVGQDYANSQRETRVYTSFEAEMDKLKYFRHIMPKEDWDTNPTLVELGELMDDPDINSAVKYSSTYLNQLYQILNSNTSRDKMEITRFTARQPETAKRITNEIVARRNGKRDGMELIKALTTMKDSMESTSGLWVDRVKKQSFILLDAAIQEVENIEIDLNQLVRKGIGYMATIKTADMVNDSVLQTAQTLYVKYNRHVKRLFEDFHFEHKKFIKDLYTDAGLKPFMDPNYKVFKRLYLNWNEEIGEDSLFPPDRPDTWMTLKDPKKDKSLSEAQKAYINFYNETVNKFLILSATHPDLKKALKSKVFSTTGRAIITKTKGIIMGPGFFDTLKESTLPAGREYETKDASTDKLKVENPFEKEIVDNGIQGSPRRRDLMGIGPDPDIGLAKHQIEKGLHIALSELVLNGAQTEYLSILNTIIDSMQMSLSRALDVSDGIKDNINESKRHLRNWTQMTLHNTYPNEGKIGKLVDRMGHIASQLVFTFSIPQTFIEASTGLTQGISTALGNEFSKLFGRKNPWFGMVSWTKSGKVFAKSMGYNSKYRVMAQENDMIFFDSKSFLDPTFTRHRPWKAFRSDLAWKANTFFINNTQTQFFFAYLMERGADDTYVQNKKGRWYYDETKDGRFYVYDEKLDFSTNKPPSTPEEIQKHDYWMFYRAEMEKDGDIKKNGRMRYVLRVKERQKLKRWTKSTLGSMSSDGYVLGHTFAFIRGMSRYKNWFFPRISNNFTPSMKMQAWMEDEYTPPTYDEEGDLVTPGSYKEIYPTFEGYIQTLYNMTAGLLSLAYKGEGYKLNEIQKDNLGKLLSDMILYLMWAILGTSAYGALDEWLGDDSYLAATIRRSTSNALGELMFFRTLIDMTDNILPALATLASALKYAGAGISASFTDDPDAAWDQFSRGLSMFGAYRTLRVGASVF